MSINFISCNQCGVVLDKDKIVFPAIYDHDTQDRIEENSEWSDTLEKWVSREYCPVCNAPILDE